MREIVDLLARELALVKHALANLERRQANFIRPGTVHSVDAGTYRARVKLSDGTGEPFLSPSRPWASIAGGKAQDWTPLEVGQQVMMFSPSGVSGQGLIIPFGYSDDIPPPSTSGDERLFRRGGSILAMQDAMMRFESEVLNFKGESKFVGDLKVDGIARLGEADAATPVMLEGGRIATKVFGV